MKKIRRRSNLNIDVLNNTILKYHEDKKKSIIKYFSLLDELSYLLNEFSIAVKDLRNLNQKEQDKDAKFSISFEKQFGYSYRDTVKKLEMFLPPKLETYFYKDLLTDPQTKIVPITHTNHTDDPIPRAKPLDSNIVGLLKNIELNKELVNFNLEKNTVRLYPEQVLITDKNKTKILINKQDRRANTLSGDVLKKTLKGFHQAKEIFLYTYLGKLNYIEDVLIQLKNFLPEFPAFVNKAKDYDDMVRKKFMSLYGFEYHMVHKLYLHNFIDTYMTLKQMVSGMNNAKIFLNRKLEMNNKAMLRPATEVEQIEGWRVNL